LTKGTIVVRGAKPIERVAVASWTSQPISVAVETRAQSQGAKRIAGPFDASLVARAVGWFITGDALVF